MTNEQRAEKLIKRLGFNFECISKDEIRGLTEQEILHILHLISACIRKLKKGELKKGDNVLKDIRCRVTI